MKTPDFQAMKTPEYKLPHDLSAIEGKIPISALDDNFDSLQAHANQVVHPKLDNLLGLVALLANRVEDLEKAVAILSKPKKR